MWHELGSNTQRWDDGRFSMLKISILNYSATGVAMINSVVAFKIFNHLHDKNYLHLNQARTKFVQNRTRPRESPW